jgi:hypothetical protein
LITLGPFFLLWFIACIVAISLVIWLRKQNNQFR